MRINRGEFKGKKFSKIKGIKIRPTSDKIKEAIFNILGSDIIEKKILDLFAGTGALGIEAISRGANFCVFIDNDRYAVSIINKNIKACSIENRTRVIKKDIIENRRIIDYLDYPFDIVFLDPPYKEDRIVSVLEKISNALFEDAKVIIVAEHSVRRNLPESIGNFILYDTRKYGTTRVSFLKSF